MLGDQVYADEVSPATRAFIETKRNPNEPPGERVVDFEDYTQLYLESWGDARAFDGTRSLISVPSSTTSTRIEPASAQPETALTSVPGSCE